MQKFMKLFASLREKFQTGVIAIVEWNFLKRHDNPHGRQDNCDFLRAGAKIEENWPRIAFRCSPFGKINKATEYSRVRVAFAFLGRSIKVHPTSICFRTEEVIAARVLIASIHHCFGFICRNHWCVIVQNNLALNKSFCRKQCPPLLVAIFFHLSRK